MADAPRRTTRSTPPFPGGLAETRQLVRRRGGIVGLGVSASLWFAGTVLGFILPGAVGGVVSFSLTVMAFPFMPMLGIPAAGGAARIGIALVLSSALWWTLGQVAAGRATRGPVAGWREWSREFAWVGLGIWVGAVAAPLLGAVALGYL